MKKSLILLCIVLLSGASAWSQKAGFYGKKLFVEFSGLGAVPLINNWRNNDNEYYVKSGSSGVSLGNDKFNAGFHGGIGIVMDHEVAFSLTGGVFYSNIIGPKFLYFPEPSFNELPSFSVNHQNLKIRSLSLMPVMYFTTNKSSILPAGFSHELGFGFVRTKVLEKDYAFETDYNGNQVNFGGKNYDAQDFMDSVVNVNGDYIDYDRYYKSFTLMYGLKMRTPIGKQLMINYGIRYTINIAPREYSFGSSPTIYSSALDDHIAFEIRQTRMRSVCALQLGLTYLFR